MRFLTSGLLIAVFFAPGATHAGSFQVLYNFQGGYAGPDGAQPNAGLLADKAGNLYGSTEFGGSAGYGVIFRLAPDGTETVLHSFKVGGDGFYPQGPLIADKEGNLYGTTEQGGGGCRPDQCGSIFEITPDGTETVLYAFKGGSDGCYPFAGLVADSRGNFYGTTAGCGSGSGSSCDMLGCGTVFRYSPDGKEEVLYSFQGGSDGYDPVAPLILDSEGDLYGTTLEGGSGGGIVFRIAPDSTETVLYRFCSLANCADGAAPDGGVIADADANLYGTTSGNGGHVGNVFKLAPDGTETVLHSFNYQPGGLVPVGSLTSDTLGNLYGSTEIGGDFNRGVVFKVATDGAETVLHSFHKRQGYEPAGNLILINGYLYGAATAGGESKNCYHFGCGTVFVVEK